MTFLQVSFNKYTLFFSCIFHSLHLSPLFLLKEKHVKFFIPSLLWILFSQKQNHVPKNNNEKFISLCVFPNFQMSSLSAIFDSPQCLLSLKPYLMEINLLINPPANHSLSTIIVTSHRQPSSLAINTNPHHQSSPWTHIVNPLNFTDVGHTFIHTCCW